MKKSTFLLFITFLLFSSLPAASADGTVIHLISKPHQLFDGSFRNDELATDLLSSGRLGKALEQKRVGSRTWIIDGELLDEVADMADGYELADNNDGVGVEAATAWLAQLRIATAGGVITPVTYGNPDLRLAKRLAPSELTFYKKYGADRFVFG